MQCATWFMNWNYFYTIALVSLQQLEKGFQLIYLMDPLRTYSKLCVSWMCSTLTQCDKL